MSNEDEEAAARRAEAAAKRAEKAAEKAEEAVEKASESGDSLAGSAAPKPEVRNAASSGSGKEPGPYED